MNPHPHPELQALHLKAVAARDAYNATKLSKLDLRYWNNFDRVQDLERRLEEERVKQARRREERDARATERPDEAALKAAWETEIERYRVAMNAASTKEAA